MTSKKWKTKFKFTVEGIGSTIIRIKPNSDSSACRNVLAINVTQKNKVIKCMSKGLCKMLSLFFVPLIQRFYILVYYSNMKSTVSVDMGASKKYLKLNMIKKNVMRANVVTIWCLPNTSSSSQKIRILTLDI